jgi:putative oxidoreductase
MTRSLDSGVILLARIALAILFLWGGVMKLTGYEGFVAYLHSAGVPLAPVAAPLSTATDLIGGLFLIVGFRIQSLALIMAVYTVVTALYGHDFWNVVDPVMHHDTVVHFWKNVGIAGGFLLLGVTGAGRISVDARAMQRSGSFARHSARTRVG